MDASVKVIFYAALTFAAYLVFAGHNQPGGGFAGGLVAGAALAVRYVAGGIDEVRAIGRWAPWTLLAVGLALATTTALVPLAFGDPLVSHATFSADLPVLGKVKATSALVFDIGVLFVVVGLVRMVFEAFGEEPAGPSREAPR